MLTSSALVLLYKCHSRLQARRRRAERRQWMPVVAGAERRYTSASSADCKAYLVLSIGLQSRCQVHVQTLHRPV